MTAHKPKNPFLYAHDLVAIGKLSDTLREGLMALGASKTDASPLIINDFDSDWLSAQAKITAGDCVSVRVILRIYKSVELPHHIVELFSGGTTGSSSEVTPWPHRDELHRSFEEAWGAAVANWTTKVDARAFHCQVVKGLFERGET